MTTLAVSVAKNKKGSIMKFRMMLSALLLAAGLVCVVGCGKLKKAVNKDSKTDAPAKPVEDETNSPKYVYNAWKAAILRNDRHAADRLSTKSRVIGSGNEIIIEWNRQMPGARLTFEETVVVAVEENGDKAVLTLKDDEGKESKRNMVKVNGKWRVGD